MTKWAEKVKEYENYDRELWRERAGDYYAPCLFVTKDGGIGIDVGGHVIVLPIRTWHRLATVPAQTTAVPIDGEEAQPNMGDWEEGPNAFPMPLPKAD